MTLLKESFVWVCEARGAANMDKDFHFNFTLKTYSSNIDSLFKEFMYEDKLK
jgi:hypothetical protein